MGGKQKLIATRLSEGILLLAAARFRIEAGI